MKKVSEQTSLAVIGGGPAGMMAAITAARAGADVTLLERGDRLGHKLSITGKGRCNVTNNCPWEEALGSVLRGGRFLYSAFSRFPPQDTMDFFEDLGLALKTERGGRVFPQSDKAADVIAALHRGLDAAGVKVWYKARVKEILTENGAVTGVSLEGRTLLADGVILATGGLSYPRTGSTGDGHGFARALGHTVTDLTPSLVPLEGSKELCSEMQGLALRNVGLTLLQGDKTLYQDFGELLFTHFGLSGPIVLSASAHLVPPPSGPYRAVLDLKPALDRQTLDQRLLRELQEGGKRSVKTILGTLLPRLLIAPVARRAGLELTAPGHAVTKEMRLALLEALKAFSIDLGGTRPIDEAIVTAGGVSLKEINPSTMASKAVSGLYFAGEVMDADAYTGGFNLQIAWATGHAAGLAAAR